MTCVMIKTIHFYIYCHNSLKIMTTKAKIIARTRKFYCLPLETCNVQLCVGVQLSKIKIIRPPPPPSIVITTWHDTILIIIFVMSNLETYLITVKKDKKRCVFSYKNNLLYLHYSHIYFWLTTLHKKFKQW